MPAGPRASHNVKFGGEYEAAPSEPLRDPNAVVSLHRRPHGAGARRVRNNFNAFADFLLGEANSSTSESMTPMIGDEPTVDNLLDFRPGTLRTWQYGTYIRDQFELNRKMTVSVGVRWEYYPLSSRADRGLEIFDFASRELLICGVAGIDPTAASRWRRTCLRRGLAGRIGPPNRRSFASATRATPRTTPRPAIRCRRSRRFRRRLS